MAAMAAKAIASHRPVRHDDRKNATTSRTPMPAPSDSGALSTRALGEYGVYTGGLPDSWDGCGPDRPIGHRLGRAQALWAANEASIDGAVRDHGKAPAGASLPSALSRFLLRNGRLEVT